MRWRSRRAATLAGKQTERSPSPGFAGEGQGVRALWFQRTALTSSRSRKAGRGARNTPPTSPSSAARSTSSTPPSLAGPALGLLRLRGPPPLSRRRRPGPRRRRADRPGDAAHPEAGRGRPPAPGRRLPARRAARPQPRRARPVPDRVSRDRPGRRFLAQRRQRPDGRPVPAKRPETADAELRSELGAVRRAAAARRRRRGSRPSSISTCRCFTWSTASSRRSCPTARTGAIAAGRATGTGSISATASGRRSRCSPTPAAAIPSSTPCRSRPRSSCRGCSGLGVRWFRVELLRETAAEVGPLLDRYARVLAGRDDGRGDVAIAASLNQLGVTRGTLQMA